MSRPRLCDLRLREGLQHPRWHVHARAASRPGLHRLAVDVAALIQAHPDRAALAEELADCLGGAEVVYDPDPLAPLRSPWRTYRACLERGLQTGADAILVIQDDVLVCEHLLEGAALAAAAHPDRPVALFVPGKPTLYVVALSRARTAGDRYAELPLGTWVPTVALVWPAPLAANLLEWYDEQRLPPQLAADDEIVGRYLRHVAVPAVATVPSLVEHPDTVPSVMNGHRRAADGRDPTRRALYWIGDEPGFGCDARAVCRP